jgi:hypothetical protein
MPASTSKSSISAQRAVPLHLEQLSNNYSRRRFEKDGALVSKL